ncbi:MAG: DNA repair exonuclease [Desulfovibrionaceae bacterium]
MYPVRYIHAADLHLDAAFKGLSRECAGTGPMAQSLPQATFTALQRLVDICEAEKPDFLVIAGDIYNQEDRSIKAQLRLLDACQRLESHGIRIFLAHGNHDPLSSRLQTIRWPDNVTIFGEGIESWPIMREGVLVAVVHGISHSTAKEGRNLALGFSRQRPRGVEKDSPCFHLGVLHCSVEGGSGDTHDRYAPCTLADLKNTHLDAWALGHIHHRGVLSTEPFVAYAGNTQGLHILENGPRGCLLVQATPTATSSTPPPLDNSAETPSPFTCTADFKPLGPVQWETLDVDISTVQHLDSVENTLLEALEAAAAKTGVHCQALIARIRVSGRTVLDKDLRTPAVLHELTERLRANSLSTPQVWIKDIDVHTGQALDMEALSKREDLLGEVVRLAQHSGQSPHEAKNLASPALEVLFKHTKAKNALTPLDDAQITDLITDAQKLCIDLMEAR